MYNQKKTMEDEIIKKIKTSLKPEYLEIINESSLHQNHASSPNTGESHFYIKIKSKIFNNKKAIESHRIIYDILDEEIKKGLHAIRIKIIKN